MWNLYAKSRYYPCAMFVSGDRLIVIRQDTSKEQIDQIVQTTARLFAESETTYVMGISTVKRGYRRVPKLLDEATAAMKHAAIQGKSVFYYSDIGIHQLLFGIKNDDILTEFYTATLKDILDYDQRNKTDYAQVLYEYLKCDGSISAVADRMAVHRNTVNNKIKSIKSIFDIEFTGEKKTELLLAFMAKEIIDKQSNKRR